MEASVKLKLKTWYLISKFFSFKTNNSVLLTFFLMVKIFRWRDAVTQSKWKHNPNVCMILIVILPASEKMFHVAYLGWPKEAWPSNQQKYHTKYFLALVLFSVSWKIENICCLENVINENIKQIRTLWNIYRQQIFRACMYRICWDNSSATKLIILLFFGIIEA